MLYRKFRAALAFLALSAVLLSAALTLHSRGTVVILMYHHLVPDGGETNGLTITESKFRRDMQYLRESGCVTLSPAELYEVLRGRQSCPPRAVVVSFDDGYRSNYDLAYPILQETGCKAVISLITANIHEGADENPFMLCWPQVEEMAADGLVSFGSHTDNLHNPETGGELRPEGPNGVERLPDETREQYHERVGADLRRSCAQIAGHTGDAVIWFAYPYGAGDRWCESLLNENDVLLSVSTNAGRVRTGGRVRSLPRYAIHEDTELSALLGD